LLALLGLLNGPNDLGDMRKLGNVGIIRVITKTVSGFLFFRARSNLMVAITAVEAQIVSLSVVSDLLFRGVRGGYLKVSAGLLAVLVILTLITRIKLHQIIIGGGVRGCLGLLRLRDLVQEIGLVLELRILIFTDIMLGFFHVIVSVTEQQNPIVEIIVAEHSRNENHCRLKFVKYAALKDVDFLLGSFATFGGQNLELRNKNQKKLAFHFPIVKFHYGNAGKILGFVLIVKSGEDPFMSLLRPKVGVLGVFVIHYEAGFEKAVCISL
jgi:hypothetical protein